MNETPTLEQLIESARRDPEHADFTALRMAFVTSDLYQPYGSAILTDLKGIARNDDPQLALGRVYSLIDRYPISIDAHTVAAILHRRCFEADKALEHSAFVHGLLSCILKSGDGKSCETAFVVCDTSEEYAVLEVLNLKGAGQSLRQNGDQWLDVFTVKSDSGADSEVHFDITVPYKWLGRRFSRR
jgi:hypothetical protein